MLVKVSQAAQVLGLSIKTIERAIEAGHIVDQQRRPSARVPGEKRSGPRFYLIDLAETRHYFEERGTLLRLPPPEGDAAVIHELLDEIERLKKELGRYSHIGAATRRDRVGPAGPINKGERAASQRDAPPASAATPPDEARQRGRMQRPNALGLLLTFDNGIMSGHSIRKLGNAHGMRGETARQAWAEKMGEARRSRAGVLMWMQHRLREQQMPPMFRCIDGDCDCQGMSGEWRERSDDEATDAMKLAPLPEVDRNRVFRERQAHPAEGMPVVAEALASE